MFAHKKNPGFLVRKSFDSLFFFFTFSVVSLTFSVESDSLVLSAVCCANSKSAGVCWNCGLSFSTTSVCSFGGAAVVFLAAVFLTAVFFVVVFLTAGFGGSTAAAGVVSTMTGAGFFFCGSSSAKKASNKSSPIPEFQIKFTFFK